MTESENAVCFICKTNGDVILFKQEQFNKCKVSLMIRKACNLKDSDKNLPEETDSSTGYHVACYRSFNAIGKKHRERYEQLQKVSERKRAEAQISEVSGKDVNNATADSETFTSAGITNDTVELLSSCSQDKSIGESEDVVAEDVDNEETSKEINIQTDPDDVSRNPKCVICSKSTKYYKRRLAILHTVGKSKRIVNIIRKSATEENDIELLNRLDEHCSNNVTIRYHQPCINSIRTRVRIKASDKSCTWHKKRDFHQIAFKKLCDFVEDNVVHGKKCFLLKSLRNIFSTILIKEYQKNGLTVKNVFDTRHIGKKLLAQESFKKKINLIYESGGKTIVAPYDVRIITNIRELENEDHIQKAAMEIRTVILKMEKRKIPDKVQTKDLIAGECDIPEVLITFFQTILRGYDYQRKNDSEKDLRIESLASDLIYATTRGKIKPSKQIMLGIALKSLTSSKKVLSIINKFGHCISYNVVEEFETEAAFSSTSRSLLCPINIETRNDLHTGVAFDNFDRFVETTTGKQTLHDTVGIIYQDTCEEKNDDALQVDIPDETSGKKRRRTFDVIMPDLEPVTKKLKFVGQLREVTNVTNTPANLNKVKMIDTAWIISHALNIRTPMWVGFNARLLNDSSPVQKVSYLPPINLSPTDPSVVMETMKRAIKIADECDQTYIAVTYDLAIAKIAMQLQSMYKDDFSRVFIHLGPFHIEMSYLKAVGSFVENCGLTNVMVESGLLAAGSVGGFLSAKNFNRAKRLHILVSLSLKIEHFELFLRKRDVQIQESVIAYLKTLQSHELTDNTIDNATLQHLIEQYLVFKEETLAGLHGKTPQYYATYMNLIDHYLMFNRSIRTGDFELMKFILPKINNIFFPLNHVNYARWLLKYCDNLTKVEETHPNLFEDFKSGYLGIKRTNKNFSRQGVDLVVEQTINADAGRTLTGITHFTNSIRARMRWSVDFALRAEICSNLMQLLGLSNVESITNDLRGDRMNISQIQIAKFRNGLKLRMNPFDESLKEELLYNVSTGEAASKEVELFLTSIESTGQEMRLNMSKACTANEDAFQTYTIKRTKVKNFTSVAKKRRMKIGEKITETKIQKDLFGRLLGISLGKKIDIEKVLQYPLTPVPLSMCHIEGIIHKTDKAVLTAILESTVEKHDEPVAIDIKVIDGFFLFHTMKQVPATFGNLSLKYLSSICSGNASEVVLVFDEYREPSIKAVERTLREGFSSAFSIHGTEQVRPSNFGAELRNDKFKTALVNFMLQHWMSDDAVDIIKRKVLYVNFDKCYKYMVENYHVTRTVVEELSCSGHEEADTKIIYHLCQVRIDSNVEIQCSDTDVLVIMLANMCNLKSKLQISLRFGTGNTRRYINVNKIYEELGEKMCRSLPGLHALTGCDYTPAFYRRGKKKPFQVLRANEKFQDAFISIFSEREKSFEVLETFVCRLYGHERIDCVNEVRFASFLKAYSVENTNQAFDKIVRSFDASLIPPCRSELFQQLMRVLYVSHIWCNAHLQYPSCNDSADGYGWKLIESAYHFHWFDGDAMPSTINEIVIENSRTEPNDEQPDENEESVSYDEDVDWLEEELYEDEKIDFDYVSSEDDNEESSLEIEI